MAILLQEWTKCAAPGCGSSLTESYGHKHCRGHAACKLVRGKCCENRSVIIFICFLIYNDIYNIMIYIYIYIHIMFYNDIY